jgi:hypothetical protein
MAKNKDQHTKVLVIFKISNASDPKVKLQAVAIVSDCYKFILDMSANAGDSIRRFEVCCPKYSSNTKARRKN